MEFSTQEPQLFEGIQDAHWHELEPLFPVIAKRSRGKPHTPWRKVVNTLIFLHLSKSKWALAPKGPQWASKSAAHRWLKVWELSGFWQLLLEAILPKLELK